jgi:hypothetical protein
MLSWEHLERRLSERAQQCAEQRRVADRIRAYETWAAGVVEQCLHDLEQDLASRLLGFDAETRRSLTVTRLRPSHGGSQHVLCLNFGLDEVHLHGQWQPGQAPTVHLLWSRRRKSRYGHLLSVAGGWLVQNGSSAGYGIRPCDGSRDEISREDLLLRALGLLTIGTR